MIRIETNNANYYFESVYPNTTNFERLTELFNSVIAPLYGDQKVALERIAARKDRVGELLIDKVSRAVCGVLVYKTAPVSEFVDAGAPEALEIKTLFVAPEVRAQGLGSLLMDRVKVVANDPKFKSIAVTVSANVPASLGFFQKKGGFTIVREMPDQYILGVVENLLVYKKQ